MTDDLFLKTQKSLHTTDEKSWVKNGEKTALRLFHAVARTVPAYKKFLRGHKLKPDSIKTLADFKHVPVITKENYLQVNPLNELVPHGDLSRAKTISTSSGSTGVPFFWPRGDAQVTEASLIHELFLVEFFEIHKKRTLFINTFAMGMWVAGTTTHESLERIASKYRMTVVAPGIELGQVLSAIKHLGRFYDQVILSGYPPFLKDVIDEGAEQGVDWKKLSIRFLFAAESFSEEWRAHLYKSAGVTSGLCGSLNIYGTADALIVAHETPLSIFIRSKITANKGLHRKFFGEDLRVPTLAQWHPTMRYFEEISDSKIIFTSASGIPLVRYDIGDRGNILSLGDILQTFAEEKVSLFKSAAERGRVQRGWNLPFVTIYGRDRMVASLYGLKIYPEHVRAALESDAGERYASGRFVMMTKMNKNNDQYLEVHIELRHKVRIKKQITQYLEELIFHKVQSLNSEYKRLVAAVGGRARPTIILHDYRTSALFNREGKQHWKG